MRYICQLNKLSFRSTYCTSITLNHYGNGEFSGSLFSCINNQASCTCILTLTTDLPINFRFIALLIFSQFLMITYLSVFSLYIKLLHDIFTTLDNIFLIDVLSRLMVEVWRHWTKTPCLVLIVRYTFTQFIVDWISSIPLEWIYLWCIDIDNMDEIKQYDYLRFNRILRFYRIFRFFGELQLLVNLESPEILISLF